MEMGALESASEGGYEEVALRDGTVVLMRRARAGDGKALTEFADSLSEESISFRFFGSALDHDLLRKELMPGPTSYVLLAMRDGRVIGHAAYYRSGGNMAEIGLVILDSFQGKGLGTKMLERIARTANLDGLSVFDTIISHDNLRMIKMVEDMGFPTSVRTEPDLIRIRFPTSIDPLTLKEFEDARFPAG
jgi:N-acetylglutamate synthase-like GNAT family acetyltransferase